MNLKRGHNLTHNTLYPEVTSVLLFKDTKLAKIIKGYDCNPGIQLHTPAEAAGNLISENQFLSYHMSIYAKYM